MIKINLEGKEAPEKASKVTKTVKKIKYKHEERISIFFNHATGFADFDLFVEFVSKSKHPESVLLVHEAALRDPELMAKRGMKKFAAQFENKYAFSIPDKVLPQTLFPDGEVFRTKLTDINLLFLAIHVFIRQNVLVNLNLKNFARAIYPLIFTEYTFIQFYMLLSKFGIKYDVDNDLLPYKYGGVPRKKYAKKENAKTVDNNN